MPFGLYNSSNKTQVFTSVIMTDVLTVTDYNVGLYMMKNVFFITQIVGKNKI